MTAPVLALLYTLALLPAAGAADQHRRTEHKIVDQTDAPVLITSYKVEYQKRTNESAEGLRHDLEYRNRTEQRIVAIQFGLVTFDVWNEFLNRTPALAGEGLSGRGRDRNTWFTSTDAGVAFHTGIVYVDRVRFESGEIWTADVESILTAMRAVQKDFDADKLKRK